MSAHDRYSKTALPQRLSDLVDTILYVAGIAGPLLVLAAGVWLVFSLIRYLIGMV